MRAASAPKFERSDEYEPLPWWALTFAVVFPVAPEASRRDSRRTTDAPSPARSRAAVTPVIPPPTTTTSAWMSLLRAGATRGRRRGPHGDALPLAGFNAARPALPGGAVLRRC